MDSFNQTNLQHIKNIFEEKTGIELNTRPRHRRPVKAAISVAAVLVCTLTMTAFAVSLFSSLSGDDLGLFRELRRQRDRVHSGGKQI